jgi:hypothetical protein
MSTIPKTPIPVHGRIPWKNLIARIEARKEHPVLGWLYVIHERQAGGAMVIWSNITQEEVVAEMDRFGRYRVGEHVRISRSHITKVVARKWNFTTGTLDYHIDGAPDGRKLVMDQERLAARITAVAQP